MNVLVNNTFFAFYVRYNLSSMAKFTLKDEQIVWTDKLSDDLFV